LGLDVTPLTESSVYPDVYGNIQAIHFFTQRRRGRREITVGDGFFAQWRWVTKIPDLAITLKVDCLSTKIRAAVKMNSFNHGKHGCTRKIFWLETVLFSGDVIFYHEGHEEHEAPMV
jgi:hypothetical protein